MFLRGWLWVQEPDGRGEETPPESLCFCHQAAEALTRWQPSEKTVTRVIWVFDDFVSSASASFDYSELTEIKTFTGINLAQSLHVCKPRCKRMLVWYPLARLHGLKQKYFQHCDVTNCPAPHIENVPNCDTTVSYRTVNLWTVTPLIYIQVHLNKLECRGKVHLFQ